jgi:hypothetical protein
MERSKERKDEERERREKETHMCQPMLFRLGRYHRFCTSMAKMEPAMMKQGAPRICKL